MKKLNKVLLPLMIVPLLFSCNNKEQFVGVVASSSATDMIVTTDNKLVVPFNTFISLKYFKDSKEQKDENFDKNLQNSFARLVTDYHKKLDRHNFYYEDDNKTIVTNVKTINESYGTGEEIVCSQELYDLLKLGHRLTLDTKGAFNFYMGALTSYWDLTLNTLSSDQALIEVYDPLYSETEAQEVARLQKSIVSLEEVENIMTFNDEKRSVIFNSVPDKDGLDRDTNESVYRPQITSGGIAKGYATELLKDNLVKNGLTRGYISAGGSSITTLSDDLFEVAPVQNISITDPRQASIMGNDVIAKIALNKSYSLSTSGTNTFEKFYYAINPKTNKIVKRHHIINPVTGEPSLHHACVTIVSNTFDNGEMDALSTAFVNLSTEDGLLLREDILKKYPEHDLSIVFVDSEDGVKLDYTIVGEIEKDVTILNKGE